MNRVIITIEIEVADMTRAVQLKQALETQASALPENVKISTRYDENEEFIKEL